MFNYYLKKIRLFVFQKSFLFSLALGDVFPPKFVIWDCTRRCNLNCEHCGAKKEKYSRELTTQQVKDLVKKLSSNKVKNFVATGGEPLLREDLFEIFFFAKENGLKTGIATNGFFIDNTNAKVISEIFDSVQISLDGPAKVHNKIRRHREAFERAVRAINLLKKTGCKQITICSVITPSNIKDLENLAEIVKSLGVDIWKITTVMPVGRAEQNTNLFLNREEFLKLLNFIRENKNKIKIDLGENIGYLGKWDEKVRNDPFFCPVGFLVCCVGVDGNVRGCPEQPDIPYYREGNILEKDFFEIWRNGFQKYRNRELPNDKECQKCKFNKDCNGGCWVMKLQNINCSIKTYSLQ